jgi:valyl-tRNA synthetase
MQEARNFAWHDLADYYLEMVKHRLYKADIYGEESRIAAQYTLKKVLETVLRLLAPFTPHTTAEIYSEMFGGSVHEQSYPQKGPGLVDEQAEKTGELMVRAVDEIRKYNTDNNMSLGSELEKGTVFGPKEVLEKLKLVETDIKGTGRIKELSFEEAEEIGLELKPESEP